MKFFNEGKPRMINKKTTTRNSKQNVHVFRIYTLSDLGVSSNLSGMLSLANEHYSLPSGGTMLDPNKNKMDEKPENATTCCTRKYKKGYEIWPELKK